MNEIDALFAAWQEAVRNGDIDALLSLMTEDATFWSRETPEIRGRENIRALHASFQANFHHQQTFDEVERIVEGGFAFIRGIEHNTLTPKSGGAPTEIEQRVFMILRLDADGKWRFARGMTNRASREVGR